MELRLFLVSLLFALPVPALAGPQRPLAIGTYNQLVVVMRAADRCGFKSYRISIILMGDGSRSRAVYTDDDRGSYQCVEAWMKRSGAKLGLASNP